MANKVLTKAEIFRRMERYLDDPEKIISVSFMAELAGCEEHTVYKIFRQKNMPLSERMQVGTPRVTDRSTSRSSTA